MASVKPEHLHQEEKPDTLTLIALTVCKQQSLISCERTYLIKKKKKEPRQQESTNCCSRKKKSVQAQFSDVVNWCDSSKINGAGSNYTSCGSGPKRVGM